MNQSRVSIEDIAWAASVSHSTVSRVLRDSPLISAVTRNHIQYLAREMGWLVDADIACAAQRGADNYVLQPVLSVRDSTAALR